MKSAMRSRSRSRSFLRRLVVPFVVLALLLVACGGDDTASSGDAGPTGTEDGGTAGDESPGGDETEAAAEFDPVMLDVTTALGGPENYLNIALADYLEAAKDASAGLIDYEFYYSGSLVPATEVMNALSTGLADLAIGAPAYNPDTFPAANWVASLASLGRGDPPVMTLSRMPANAELWWTSDAIRESDFEANGIFPLLPGVLPIVSYHLLCNEPVTDLESARGIQVRTSSEATAAEASSLGMEPVFLPGAEMFEALQRGVIDCVMSDTPELISTGVWEVADHFSYVGFTGFLNGGAYFSQSTWDALPLEAQQILWDQLPVYIESVTRQGLEAQRQFVEGSEDQGIELHAASEEMQQAVGTFQEEQLRTTEGAPATVSDPEDVLSTYTSLADKWDSIVMDDLGVTPYETWEAWVEADDRVDVETYAQRFYEEVFLPRRP